MRKPSSEEFEKRFWARTIRDPETGCLIWAGTIDAHGYGAVGWGRYNQRKCHRVAYELIHGVKLTPDQKILHSCDNPPCIEPSHLRIGTQLDNIADMNNRGRHHKLAGEDAPRAKITAQDVMKIRTELAHLPRKEVGDMYGIHRTSVSAIVHGKTWGCLSKS